MWLDDSATKGWIETDFFYTHDSSVCAVLAWSLVSSPAITSFTIIAGNLHHERLNGRGPAARYLRRKNEAFKPPCSILLADIVVVDRPCLGHGISN